MNIKIGTKKKNRAFLIIGFLIITFIISANESSSILYSKNQKIEDPRSKIDERLLNKINDPNCQDEEVKLIIVTQNQKLDSIRLPSSTSIITKYQNINSLLVKTIVSSILSIAKDENVISIWWDLPFQSDLSSSDQIFPFLKAAVQDTNTYFANFTEEISAEQCWDEGYNGSNVIIAIMDAGVDITGAAGGDIDDFDENTTTTDPKYLGGVSFVPEEPLYYTDLNGRGTFHTGIACGTGAINQSYIGVAPGASYLNVKIYDSLGITYWSFIISGIEWAIEHGADIILFTTTIPGLYLDPVCMTVNNAVDRGVLVVAPVGDDGPSYMSINTPGQAQKALTVGAYNSFTGDVWNQSSRGPTYDFGIGPEIIAPGVGLIGPRSRIFSAESIDMLSGISDFSEQFGFSFDFDLNIDLSSFTSVIPTTLYGEEVPNEGNYTRASSTGAAAAVVAGAAAILLSAYPLATPIMIEQAFLETANSITLNNDLNSEGAGLINVSAAFNWLNKILIPNEYEIIPLSVPLLYAGVITSTDYQNVSQYSEFTGLDLLSYDVSALFSTQAMMTGLLVSNSTDMTALNMTSIHLPLNQFGLEYSLSNDPDNREFHWFSEFNVEREFHQLINAETYQEGYKRCVGVLSLNGLYTAVLAETWSYAGEYNDTTFQIEIPNPVYNYSLPTEYRMMNITDRVNAIKFSFYFINDREDQQNYQNLSLYSYFKADLYLNETGIASNTYPGDYSSALSFSMDDTVGYNETNQICWVEDTNNNTFFASSDKNTAMGFQSGSHNISKYAITESIGLLLNITLDKSNASDWNTTVGQNNQYYSGNGEKDPGFAQIWQLEDIPYGDTIQFIGALGIGQANSTENARNIMNKQIDLILNKVTEYNITDLMVLSANFSRMANEDENYISQVKVINIGNVFVENSELAFVVNKSNTEDMLEIKSSIYFVHDIEPFKIFTYEASWVPLEIGVYSIGWVFGDLENIVNIQSEANILSNSLARTVFIINGSYYDEIKYEKFMMYPMSLDQNPMKINSPLDYAIYNLTSITIRKMEDVIISTDGLGKNVLFFLDDNFNISSKIQKDLEPYSSIVVLILGNPICPPGIVKFNITFSSAGNGEPFYKLPVEFTLNESRGRIWFDAVHLNLFPSSNLVGGLGPLSDYTNIEDLNISLGGDEFGNFDSFDELDLDSSSGLDISQFIDLNERLDTTWGNFYNLRELWAEPSNNNGKGASLFTIIPLLTFNLTELTGFDISTLEDNLSMIENSFLGNTLGSYNFESEVLTTNYINHDLLQFFDGLVINDPEQAFLDREIENITSWVAEGGTLYVWSEDGKHTNIESLNDLLEPFALELETESFYKYSEYGYYQRNLTLDDKYSDLFGGNSDIKTLEFKDPIRIHALNSSATTLVDDIIGISEYGQGKIIVVGDNDIFKELLLEEVDNAEFAAQILRWGQENYYDCNITVTNQNLNLYEQGFVDVNITNFDEIQAKNLTSKGFLFVAAYFYENGSMINASLYGFETPALPMFHTDGSHYSIHFDTTWNLIPGDYYILILIDHPAATSEVFYVKFHVSEGIAPEEVLIYQIPEPRYPHYVDIIAILAITYMGLTLWYYDLEKYKTRLKITPLKGDFLNIAKTRLNEGKTLVKFLMRSLEKGDVEEIERIRYLLSNRKRLTKYFKDLKKFGESIGEHY